MSRTDGDGKISPGARSAFPQRTSLRSPCITLLILLPLAFGAVLNPGDGRPERVLRVDYLSSRCDYCTMLFQDKRFGGELQTTADSSLYFDATECMAAYRLSNAASVSRIKKMWSVDYNAPGTLIDATNAVYVRSPNIASPMEVGIAAFRSSAEADSALARFGGRKTDWQGVLGIVDSLWFHVRKKKQ